jgi:hypothetical protein
MFHCSFTGAAVRGQQAPTESKKLYDDLRAFRLGGGSVSVDNLSFHRDRGEMTFTSGTIYFESPIQGHVYGAVFIGEGKFHADPPPTKFEKENVKRMIGADFVESDFKTAILRFTDDTYDVLKQGNKPGEAAGDVQKLASDHEFQIIKETGANIAARLTVSILNAESPGFFMAQFDKGHRGRFSYLFDPQGRVPSEIFEINGGEKGLILSYDPLFYSTNIWMAFYSLDDYAKRRVDFSDVFDQAYIRRHDMNIDVKDPFSRWLRYDDQMQIEVMKDGLRAIRLEINESLSTYDEYRLKRALRLKSIKSADGLPVEAIQEDWEAGLTLLFPAPLAKGQKLDLTFRMEGQHLAQDGPIAWMPETDSWYLRHGYLQRSTYKIVFHHTKRFTPVTVGTRTRDAQGEDKSDVVTEWDMDSPTPFLMFDVGDNFNRYQTEAKIGDRTIPIELDVPSSVKADFMGAEMNNSLRYYSALFGPYPYNNLHAAFHSAGYGQGMATFILYPNATIANEFTYVFLSHEVAHQWWGDLVAWRSYRDQWLSEGFAEYSALLYTGRRDNGKSRQDLIDRKRYTLKEPPRGIEGNQNGRLAELGPIILGHRLYTLKTRNAYQALIYDKGSLVLRMLHFIFTDQSTLDEKPFFEMMTDFVNKHAGAAASTEDFIAAANARFASTAIAKQYHLTNLNWFFDEWVYSAALPSYRLEYSLNAQPDGSVLLKGTLFQDGTPPDEKWFMPLPLVMTFGKDRVARGVIAALGPETPINIKLEAMPQKVELDPDMFVLSLKTSATKEH